MSTYNAKDFDIFIGIDVDQTSYSFTVRDHKNMNQSKKIPADFKHFYNFLNHHYANQKILCAYEVGGTGYGLYDHLTDNHISCLMVSPQTVAKPANDTVKNNRLDSIKIANQLKNGDLPSIRVPSGCYRDLRQWVRSREDYVTLGKIAKQRIKALLLFANLHKTIKDDTAHWSGNYIQQLKTLLCPLAIRQRLDSLLEDLTYARTRNLKTLKELRTFCKDNPELQKNIDLLKSIPGIGFIVAVTILANIGDPKYLRHPQELAGFIGLTPREYSTGDKIIKGRISHMGNATLRSLLIESAWTAKRFDIRLEQFYQRIRSKHTSVFAAKKAIVAVARKMTLIIYRVLKDQRTYVRM